MRLKSVLLVVSLIVMLPAAGALAQTSPIGPQAVWKLPDQLLGRFQKCGDQRECLMAVMRQGGASSQAMAFTMMMKDNCFLSEFKKMGKVDLAFVAYPGRANTNGAYFMVNGTPPMISTEEVNENSKNENKFYININKDPLYSSLSTRYRNLGLWPPALFKQLQTLPNGGQRFIFAYYLIDGPHAGEKVGSALVAFDFDGNGRFLQTRLLSLTREIPR
jgi:hypothetical protein